MKQRENMKKNDSSRGGQQAWRKSRFHGLQVRMTVSYVGMTVIFILILEILVSLFLILVLNNLQYGSDLALAKRVGIQYAYAAAIQANDTTLNAHTTFMPDQPASLVPLGRSISESGPGHGYTFQNISIPYVAGRNPPPSLIATGLLIASNGRIVASSYPYRYPINKDFSVLLPQQMHLITHALQGIPTVATGPSTTLHIAETVWGRNAKPIGVFYMEGTMESINFTNILPFAAAWIPITGLVFLVITTPIGGLFGLLTTHGLVRRIRHLAAITTSFAHGDYTQRMKLTRKDEVGQLELDFNSMADQLVNSIAQQQELAGQNARLEERTRISRELHDAISQDLFSVRMLAYGLHDVLPVSSELQTHVSTLEQTTSRIIHEMRALLLELRPAHLEQLGLVEALKDLAATYSERLGIAVTTTIASVSLSPEMEHALLRIAQEAVSNAVRHAHATQITLSLASFEGQVKLTVTDNGAGFVFDESHKQYGLGLHLMQERIAELQGIFTLDSSPGQGTQIAVCVPQKEVEV